MRHVPVLALFAGLVLASSASAQEAPPDYGVQPGDRVDIDFFTAAGTRLVEVAGERTVDRHGEIFLPYVGTVSVEGLDATDIRLLLTERYSAFYASPVVDVTTSLRVNVTGGVREPGNYFVDPTSTVLDAIATAGGMTSELTLASGRAAADPSRVRLVRATGETLVFDFRPAFATEDALTRTVQSGDWIDVPTRPGSRFRENVGLAGSIASIVASVVAVIVLIAN